MGEGILAGGSGTGGNTIGEDGGDMFVSCNGNGGNFAVGNGGGGGTG